jgi:hypothetical protein
MMGLRTMSRRKAEVFSWCVDDIRVN